MIADRLPMVVMSRQEFWRGEPGVTLFMVDEQNGMRCEVKVPQRLAHEVEKARRGTKLRLSIELVLAE